MNSQQTRLGLQKRLASNNHSYYMFLLDQVEVLPTCATKSYNVPSLREDLDSEVICAEESLIRVH